MPGISKALPGNTGFSSHHPLKRDEHKMKHACKRCPKIFRGIEKLLHKKRAKMNFWIR